jgi:transcriptional regulator with XRE-family HTH domain
MEIGVLTAQRYCAERGAERAPTVKFAEWNMSEAESSAADYFAAELRGQRAQRGWTQVETGEKIGYSGSYVSDLERGDRLPSLQVAQACDRVFGTPDTFARWHEIAKRAAYPSFFAPVIPLEQEAARIHGWELGSVPGLLQTEQYARALIRATRPQDGEDAVERLVSARLDRQEILRGDKAPRLWYVLDEGVLRRVVGNGELMAVQLEHLLTCARTSGTVLQVVPFDAGDHAGTDGPITLYEFVDRSSVIYAECNRGGRIVEDPAEVADMITTLNMIRASALSPRDTVDLLTEIRSGIDG